MSSPPTELIISRDPLPHDDYVEADGDEASVKTSASIYNYSSDNSSILSEYRGYLYNGRLYQQTRDSALKMPSDKTQYESMEANHIVHVILDSQQPNPLFRAPIRADPEYILDLGTGQGQWAIDVADRHPTAAVHGIDLFPPPQTWVPTNCSLTVDDYTKPWFWPMNQKFDLVHGRYLIGSVSDKEWEEVYREAYEHIAPGGWIERLEVDVIVRCDDDTMPSDSLLAKIGQQFIDTTEQTDISPNTAYTMRGMIEKAGFINVHEKRTKIPIGPWARHPIYKSAGGANMMSFKVGIEGWIMDLFTKYGKPKPWTSEEVYDYLEKITRELDNGWHIYQYNNRVYAQKPFEEEVQQALKRRRPSTESWAQTESSRPTKNARELSK